ncbi:Chromosomal replication initiator protein DnaA [Candidatus Bipolaricaulis anaerobius]|jgi:chromosomal replication initiator protein|uniref:Chromosomal replication initiator protein DnaA n=2 Tax=Candidatus Bipolaricaulis anaerobius TaxID=2026885 RepID=A0A2X3KUD0_9BACT|nr:Chromosomal replication initiator protein DnaA [Candidatus Bipolaricaulis anaerobius]
MAHTAEEIWQKAKTLLVKEIPPVNFAAWIADARAKTADEGTLVLEVPSVLAKGGIERRYRSLVERVVEDVAGQPLQLRVLVAESPPAAPALDPHLARRYHGSLPLNPEYTLATFVQGKNSQLAFAAAQAVAEAPARAYNPLFIYGSVGLGKTHLLHAIGAHVLTAPTDASVVYTTSERFAIELIQSIGANTTEGFRAKYRTVDVLLIDDVHFLKNKEGTQEELFHTFNELYGNGKQIVLSSDRSPDELQGLQDRLVSRFRWGLVADIQAPDFETRSAILREKARRRGLEVPDEVVDLIASRITTNVRDLEGALIRALAYAELCQGPVTPAMLEEILPKEDLSRKLTVEAIKAEVAAAYRIPVSDIESPSRKKELVQARQIAIYLARELTETSFPALGRSFGGRDHTTIMHSYQKMQELLRQIPLLRSEIESLRATILKKYGP